MSETLREEQDLQLVRFSRGKGKGVGYELTVNEGSVVLSMDHLEILARELPGVINEERGSYD